MSNIQDNQTIQDKKEEQSVDIKALIYIFLNKWYLFFAFVVVALALGWVYNYFKTPVYSVNGTVYVKSAMSRLDPTSIMTGVNYSSMQNVDNEVAILKSYTLSENVIKKMNLEVAYYSVGRFKTAERYKSSPFTIEFDKEIPQAVHLMYNIVIICNS